MADAGGLLRETRAGHPEDVGGRDRLEVELLGCDLQVGRGRKPVEVQREVVRREDLAERDRRGQVRHRRHEAVVDTEVPQRAVDVATERVVAGAGDDAGAAAVPGRGDGDVRRAAAEELAERRHVLETDADLLGVDVDTDAPHGQDLEVDRHPATFAR